MTRCFDTFAIFRWLTGAQTLEATLARHLETARVSRSTRPATLVSRSHSAGHEPDRPPSSMITTCRRHAPILCGKTRKIGRQQGLRATRTAIYAPWRPPGIVRGSPTMPAPQETCDLTKPGACVRSRPARRGGRPGRVGQSFRRRGLKPAAAEGDHLSTSASLQDAAE